MDPWPECDQRHSATRLIKASANLIYDAFVKPERLIRWLPPEGTKGEIEHFEPRTGGRFKMNLTFSDYLGKSSAGRDVVQGRFRELSRGERIVQEISFDSEKLEFVGTMKVTWSLTPTVEGTQVTVVADDVPPGIGRAEHEHGMSSSLANLARFVE